MTKFDILINEHEHFEERIKTISEFYKSTLRDERKKYSALLDDYDELKTEFAALKKKTAKIHNERGVGRKPISKGQKQQIIEMRNNGATYRKIADTLKLAVATVYKAVNESERK